MPFTTFSRPLVSRRRGFPGLPQGKPSRFAWTHQAETLHAPLPPARSTHPRPSLLLPLHRSEAGSLGRASRGTFGETQGSPAKLRTPEFPLVGSHPSCLGMRTPLSCNRGYRPWGRNKERFLVLLDR